MKSVRPFENRPLARCGRLLTGGTPSRAHRDFWNGSIPWITAKSLKQFELTDSEDRVTESGARTLNTVPAGTVLFVVRGMSLAKDFRVGVAARPLTFNQDIRALVPLAGIDGRYLARFLQAHSATILGLVDEASHGTKRLTSDRFENISVPVPPLSEQQCIAGILDKADALRAKRREALAKLDALTQSIFLDMFGDPATNPKGWPTVRMADLFAAPPIFGTMTPPSIGGGDWLSLRVANIQDWRLDLSDQKFVNLPAKMIERHAVRDGDLLMARAIASQEHLGKAVVVRPLGR